MPALVVDDVPILVKVVPHTFVVELLKWSQEGAKLLKQNQEGARNCSDSSK